MRVLIYGSRSFADTIADLAFDCGHEVVGKVDDGGTGASILGRFADVGAYERLYSHLVRWN